MGGTGDGSAVEEESTSSEEAGSHDANGSDPIVCSSSTKQPKFSVEQLEVLLKLQDSSSMLGVSRVEEWQWCAVLQSSGKARRNRWWLVHRLFSS